MRPSRAKGQSDLRGGRESTARRHDAEVAPYYV